MIRKFKNDDTDAIIKAWRNAVDLAHPFLSEAFLEQEAKNMREIYLVVAETWVTEIEGQVVGFISLIENEIGGLFLDPAFHGQGLGRAMVDKAVAEKGAVKVEVFVENVVGRPFYTSYGFVGSQEYFHEESGQMMLRQTFTPT